MAAFDSQQMSEVMQEKLARKYPPGSLISFTPLKI